MYPRLPGPESVMQFSTDTTTPTHSSHCAAASVSIDEGSFVTLLLQDFGRHLIGILIRPPQAKMGSRWMEGYQLVSRLPAFSHRSKSRMVVACPLSLGKVRSSRSPHDKNDHHASCRHSYGFTSSQTKVTASSPPFTDNRSPVSRRYTATSN